MTIVSEEVCYCALEHTMRGRLYRDDIGDESRPAVMIFPEGFGISEHTYAVAARLAALGYIGFACDLYGEAYFHNGPSDYLRSRYVEITTKQQLMRAVGVSALNVLHLRDDVDNNRIAAIGYCLGGTVAMELGFAGEPIAAIASFHPSFNGLTLGDAAAVPCPMALFLGAEDYASPPETRAIFEQAMYGKAVRWRMNVYGSVKHSFTNPNCQGMGDAVAYDPQADRHSWDTMVQLLRVSFA